MRAFLISMLLCATSNAVQAQENQPEFKIRKLSDTIYVLKGRGGNVGISNGEDGLYIIDDQIAPVTDGLLEAIRTISERPIRFVINTHYHSDHVGGNEAIGAAGGVIIAHDNIHKRMATTQVNIFQERTIEPYPRDALPVVTFNEQLTLHLNGESATAYHVAHGHTDGDSIVHFPVSNVIHMGDMYWNGLYPFIDLDAGGSVKGVIQAADLALSLANEQTVIIPGHGPEVATTAELKAYRDYLVKASANVQALIDQGLDRQQVIAAKPTKEWDETLGAVWITPAQFVTFIYNSLKGIREYTPPPQGE